MTVKLPKNDVILDGRASSDDLGIVRYRWRQRDGKTEGLNMDDERSEVVHVTGLDVGEYRFSLTVVDAEGQRDTDYVTVMVEPGKQVVMAIGLKETSGVI